MLLVGSCSWSANTAEIKACGVSIESPVLACYESRARVVKVGQETLSCLI